jgi:monoterpene epsilon-lactone hydrolase
MKRSWQSYLVNALLRLTVKKRVPVADAVGKMRGKIDRIDSRLSSTPADLSIEAVDMAGVPGEILRVPQSRGDRILYYIHGGGFVMGALGSHREMLASWCRELGCTAYLPDYRLAPEHPFPAAPQDCIAAYRWLLDQGGDASRFVVAGDSAGGCLSLGLLQGINASGLPRPAGAVLLSPAGDLTLSGESFLYNERRDPMFHMQTLVTMRNAYVRELAVVDPCASPLFGNFDELPPLLILVGSTEMLLSESERIVERAQEARVDARLDVWRGMPHVFPAIRWLPESKQAIVDIADWIAEKGVWPESRQ